MPRRFAIGYRHIDTAEMYGNEEGVGEAHPGLRPWTARTSSSRASSTTASTSPTTPARAFEETLEKLGTDHVDLFLIHWPLPTLYDGDFVATWKTLEEFRADGRARSIGVSNFQVEHLERLAAEADVAPAVNQIELHPTSRIARSRPTPASHGIAVEAWSPIAQGEVLDDEAIAGIAQRAGRTPAQVVLRWHIQQGNIVFPKSVTPERIEENFAALRLRARTSRGRGPRFTRSR